MALCCLTAINNSMKSNCCSQNRCAGLKCVSCARRYARLVSRRIRSTASGGLYGIEIKTSFGGPADFWSWRIEARNVLDYRRRTSRWWRECCLHVWLANDGSLHGIVALGGLTLEEFIDTFGSRWPTTLRSIGQENLQNEVYAASRPGQIATSPWIGGRYQGLKLAIWPRRQRAVARQSAPRELPVVGIEPMPVLF